MSTPTPAPSAPPSAPAMPSASPQVGAAAEHARSAQIPGAPQGEGKRVTVIVVGLVLLLSGMLALFAWPAANLAPHDLPIGVAGPPQAVAAAEQALQGQSPGAFDVHTFADRDGAEAAVRQRQVYGAVVLSPAGSEILTASAASPAVAQALGQLGREMAAKTGQEATVTDVVPLPAADPRGASLGAGLLPIVLGGLVAAAALTTVVRRQRPRLVGTLAFALVGGLAMTAILQLWIGSLAGSYLLNSGVMALAIAAVASAVLGLRVLFGMPGLGLGAVVMVLLGNALSGAQAAPEMLPAGWGAVGQWLPPSATNQLLRSVAFFDGWGWQQPTLVLVAWLALGLVCLGLGALIRRT